MKKLFETLALTQLNVISILYDIVTLPIYVAIQKPKPWTIQRLCARPTAKIIAQNDKSITYQTLRTVTPQHQEIISHNVDTLDKLLDYACIKNGNKKCIGTREIIAEETQKQENGTIFQKLKMGKYRWKTYTDLNNLSTIFGKGIREMGNQPKQNLAIFAPTREEWLIAAYGLFKQNIPLVTIYSNLGEAGLLHGLNETEVKTIITTHELIPKFAHLIDKLPHVETIIYMEDQLNVLDSSSTFGEKIKVVKFSDVISLGANSDLGNNSPTPQDIAIIMYTNGSTGVPKGVLLLHENIITSIRGFVDSLENVHVPRRLIAYLPLAHVLELLSESTCLILGYPIGYSSPLTLFDGMGKLMEGCKGDLQVLKPDHITSVPLILEAIAKGIKVQVAGFNLFKRVVFKFAYNYKVLWARRGFNTPLLDRLIFRHISNKFGGRLNTMVSGGAPLSAHTHEELNTCFCLSIQQGYGLTETTASATCQTKYDEAYGSVGSPLTVTYIKLINWDEGGYKVTDKPNPRGEIVIGGKIISPGYYKQDALTKSEFFEENNIRWFKSGDIGEVDSRGALKIIDRKNDMIKLQGGEFVILGRVESILGTNPLINNIWVYATPLYDHCVAFIVPNEGELRELAVDLKIIQKEGDLPLVDLCENDIIRKAIVKKLEKYARARGLARFEIPTDIKLVNDPWTPESGLLTSSFKIRRKELKKFYQKDIDRFYPEHDYL